MNESQDVVLLDDKITPQLLNIVGEARQQVTLVAPYVDVGPWGHLKEAIQRAVQRGVKVTVLVRNDNDRLGGDKGAASIKWLIENGVTVHSLERLHAKIYLNEHSVLVSSMNLTESSATNSFEVAVLVADSRSAARIREYVSHTLLETSQPVRAPGVLAKAVRKISEQIAEYKVQPRGACIRCGTKVQFDISKPLCDAHYDEWAKWKNNEYEEKFCHSCGKSNATSYAKPLCASCFHSHAR